MTLETLKELSRIEAPYGREIIIQSVTHESGMEMLRVRIKEGSRFTILDIDQETAQKWGKVFLSWIETARDH